MTRRVVNGYVDQPRNGKFYSASVTDDGAHWLYDDQQGKWTMIAPPLPPDALGDVEAPFAVGDEVFVDDDATHCTVQRIYAEGDALLTWTCLGNKREWARVEFERLTKVPR